jgi:hypothetical protein
VYGVEPGTFTAEAGRVPVRTLFLKLSAQLGVNSRLELSHSYGHATPEVGGTHAPGQLSFSSNGAADPLEEDATRLNWSAAFGRWSNELLLGRQTWHHHCVARTPVPTVEVAADHGVLVSGAQFVCDGADDRESVWDLTHNLGWTSGAHHLTLGMHHELIRLADDLALRHTPQAADWIFTSLDSLETGLPDGYQRFLPGPLLTPSGVVAFRATQLGWYVQDQWSPDRRLTLTAGVRVDIPILTTAPTLNTDLRDSLGISTSRTPSGQPMWSPRLGVNYDVMGRGRTFLRGGVGLFTGRPAYRWFEDAYNGTGIQLLFLQCFGPDQVPAFTLDPAGQPGQCGNGELPIPEITVFDPAFRYPRDLRVSLGVDQRLPWGLVGTVDLLYVRGVNSVALRDVNLLPASGASAGEGNRPLYGTFDSIEGPFATRRNGAFGPVTQITNGPNGRSWSAAVQVQKDLGDGDQVTASYTYTDARDYQSMPGNGARSNLANSVLDGSWEHPALRTSFYSLPHKVTVGATVRLPLAIRVGVLYSGTPGYPFTYIALGDPNADGLGQGGARNNDPVYVPRNAADITLADPAQYAQLDQVIQSNRCLGEQRGRVLERNSCRLGWIGRLDVRLTKPLPSVRGHRVELSADMFNLPNFLDSDWGRVYVSGDVFGGRVPLLNLVGYDAANGRGIYEVEEVPHRQVDVAATRWRLQVSARYGF